ncbi:MAG: hypothetical protein A2Y62_00380 [Candidatus Fischerbacteria bacterium RBG_13_37_8]|uniref:Uncharacterized protein n=1 Tax=Candidatus Fischerbacteria bacterium RBG_13_37_8 TaxID=1817863 RepID=A0A1F5V9F7_9BACT|nr:MAG: hypothetical protein A2Y62_00380 [Candidatus Fischerbacteria bacterium RBG_13_37_8]
MAKNDFPIVPKPSDCILCKPKEALSSIFKKAGKEYDYMRDNARIAELCYPERVVENNQSISALIEIAEHFKHCVINLNL